MGTQCRILSAPADQTGLTGIRFLVFMRLTLNGDTFETTEAGTVMDLLKELGIVSESVAGDAVETVNREL